MQPILDTRQRTKTNKTKPTTEEIKEMSNTDSRKNCGVNQVLANVKG
jgi:hypothetical protein